jgi:hypothetical protein
MLRLLIKTQKQRLLFPARIPTFDLASECRARRIRLQIDGICNQLLDLNTPTGWARKGTEQKGGEAKHLFIGFGGVGDVVGSI